MKNIIQLKLLAFLLLITISGALACSPGQYDDAGTCFPCPVNTFSSSGNQPSCEPCIGCSACDPIKGNCLTCPGGYQLNFVFKLCQTECNVPNCANCMTPNICSTCSANFTLDSSKNTCIPNCGINFCVTCSENTCNSCLTNYILLGASCIQLCHIQNCALCHSSSYDLCSLCVTGYNLTVDMTKCVVCNIENCISCSSNNTCSKCVGDLKFMGGQCLACQVDNCVLCYQNNQCFVCAPGYSTHQNSTSIHDQCIACKQPCRACNLDGSCRFCASPYSHGKDLTCFLCWDPSCTQCLDPNQGSCQVCSYGYVLTNGTCQISFQCPSLGCNECSYTKGCVSCIPFYYLANSTCYQCPNLPSCQSCNSSNPQQCLVCNIGYYLSTNGTCLQCPSYCRSCTSDTWCTVGFQVTGYTLLTLSSTMNIPAICDPGCQVCSTSNPQFCSICLDGYYLNVENYCSPCALSSYCASCFISDPSICTSCFAGFFLNNAAICVQCELPCTACINQNPTMCSSCAIGYVLVSSNNSCVAANDQFFNGFGLILQNCAVSELYGSTQPYSLICQLCEQGYTLTSAGCAPCAQGCLICNSNSLTTCITCAPGYMINIVSACGSCSPNCLQCQIYGCLKCAQNYILQPDLTCQLPCAFPCSSCISSVPESCFSCIQGYILSGSSCVANVDCNYDQSCLACPYGYSLSTNNTNIKLNQTCAQCNGNSNCARCSLADTSSCTSCLSGYYLNGTICMVCSEGCAQCLNSNMCTQCQYQNGYIPQESGSINEDSFSRGRILNCIPCTDNCLTCKGSPSTCSSCGLGFTLVGTVCISDLNFRANVVLGVDYPDFINNYLAFLNEIASTGNISVKNILVMFFQSNPLTINLQIGTQPLLTSTQYNATQNSINNLLKQGNTVASMTITYSNIAFTCLYPLAPASNGSFCIYCYDQYCISCNNLKNCSTCSYAYAPVGGVCYLCGVANCANCNPSNMTCNYCMPNYTFNPSSNTCNVICSVTSCSSCSAPNVCFTCLPNFTLDLATNTCIQNCGINYCANCSGNTCHYCLENYILLGGSCVQLCNIKYCQTCASDTFSLCTQCIEAYDVSYDGASCFLCQVPNCTSCSSTNMCAQCQGGLTPINGQCFMCEVDNCQACSATNQCSDCLDGYSLNQNAVNNNDQCLACLDPCEVCNFNNGTCASCILPYLLDEKGSCFLCSDPRCIVCSNPNPGSCTVCNQEFTLFNGSCSAVSQSCSVGCQQCSNSTTCIMCQPQFYYKLNSTCFECPNAPACLQCASNGVCAVCSNGFYLNSNNLCQPCPAYCSFCTTQAYCIQSNLGSGFTLLALTNSSNVPAICDPGCLKCSTANPEICSTCSQGFYLTAGSYCSPCTLQNYCATCSASNPSICTSCFAGFFLNGISLCVQCQLPCTACINQNPTMCSACSIGYVLVSSNNSCVAATNNMFNQFGNVAQNCANSELTVANNGSQRLTCTLCLPGYALTETGCAPCIEGCMICNQNNFGSCLVCSAGYTLNASNVCVTDDSNCLLWSTFGCSLCNEGYILTTAGVCQLSCSFPCSTCSQSNSSSCLSCLWGYSLNGSSCLPSTTCNADQSCLTCPYGYILTTNNTNTTLSQKCAQCDPKSNCARCSPSNKSHCLNCPQGYFLNGDRCQLCSQNCLKCINSDTCLSCSPGYVAQMSGSLYSSQISSRLLNCIACASYCATCQSSPTTCTSCNSGFTQFGAVCLSNFNYQIIITLGVSYSTFMNQYLNFTNQIATAAGVNIENILIISIVSGSVTVNMEVSSNAPPGSSQAVSAQNNLNNLLAQGNSIAGMGVTSSTITTNGGSNDNGNSSSDQKVIILATVIPCAVLLLTLVIVVLCCAWQRKKEERLLMIDQKENTTTKTIQFNKSERVDLS